MSGIQVLVLLQITFQFMVAGQVYENVGLPSIENSSLAETTDSPILPPGYVEFPEFGVAYKWFAAEVSFSDARRMCINDGARLAVIDTGEKYEKVLHHFKNISRAWVGIIRHETINDKWITIYGKSTNDLPWAGGQPSGNFNCGFIWKSWGGLYNGYCYLLGDYLCEIALPNATPPSNEDSSLTETTESPVPLSKYVEFPEFGTAYKWFETKLSYNDAKRMCINDNGRLAVIDSREKFGKIVDHFENINLVWLGVYQHQGLNRWITVDGKSTNNLPWATGEPSGDNRCGVLEKTRDGIGNEDCTLLHEYLCEIELPNVTLPSIENSSLAETTDSSVLLPSGYVEFPEFGTAYKWFKTVLPYNDARKMCLNDNGQLAVIDSREKFDQIAERFENIGLVWVGLCRYKALDEWTTIDGKSTDDLPWGRGEPSGKQRCVFLWKARNGLSNGKCSLRREYLCEIALPNVSLPSIEHSSLAETTDSPVLPSGYVAFPEFGVAYKLTVSSVFYNEARKQCLNDGGQLAVIDTVEKIKEIRQHFNFTNWAWVGLGRFFDTEEWITIDGKSINNLPWADGHPRASAKCAVLEMLYDGLGTWGCWSLKSHVCEIALPTR